jgi:phosphatidylglycerophosphatase A
MSRSNEEQLPCRETATKGAVFWPRLAMFLATGAGAGRVRRAPGTIGALWGIPLAWGVNQIPTTMGQMVAIAGLCGVGVPICTAAARQLGAKDPQSVVWDEIASMSITFFLLPPSLAGCPEVWLVGFLLHRLFDISKFPPAGRLERLPEGWGIMADDCAAAVYSRLILQLLIWLQVVPFFGNQ